MIPLLCVLLGLRTSFVPEILIGFKKNLGKSIGTGDARSEGEIGRVAIEFQNQRFERSKYHHVMWWLMDTTGWLRYYVDDVSVPTDSSFAIIPKSERLQRVGLKWWVNRALRLKWLFLMDVRIPRRNRRRSNDTETEKWRSDVFFRSRREVLEADISVRIFQSTFISSQ